VVVGHQGGGAYCRVSLGAADLRQRAVVNRVAENCDAIDQLHV